MMSFLRRSSVFILAGLITFELQAQEAVLEVIDDTASSLKSSDVYPQSSSAQSSVTDENETIALVTSAQIPGNTAGICLVIDSMLKDFCKNYPGDISCQSQ